jgi:hypothetical protein
MTFKAFTCRRRIVLLIKPRAAPQRDEILLNILLEPCDTLALVPCNRLATVVSPV